MASGPLSPRQKMINMMYLVLTALLALNVSAEILKAFHMVEVSMDRAGTNIDKKNEATFKAIDKYHEGNPTDAKGTDTWSKAKKARQVAADGVKYFTDLKKVLVDGAGGRKNGDPEEEVAEASNIEKHANLMIVQGKGKEVKAKINEIRDQLIGLIPSDKKALVKSDLITEDPKGNGGQTWESEMFEHSPVAAVVTILSKTQNDIKNTEAQVLDVLKSSITDDAFAFDQLEAKIIPNNGTFITAGSQYSADIFVAASSSRQEAEVTVNGSKIPVTNGVGKYELVASGEGDKKYTAVITAKKPNGEVKTYTVEGEYSVSKPLAVISATKMNVVYIALDNPISVSVPGFSPNDVSASSSAGGILKPDKQKGTYLLRVDGSQREITITASVKDKEGKVKKMGDQKYRVRQVPKPTPMLGSIKESRDVSIGELKTASFVYANLENFAFEGLTYTPTKYQIVYQPRKGDAVQKYGSGNQISGEIKAIFNSARPGDRIIIGGIQATGQTGNVMIPTSLMLTIK